MRLVLAAVLVALLAPSGRAEACVLESPEITPHELDPAYANDKVAPPVPTATFNIARHEVDGGCTAKTDCDGKYANIYVDVVGSDDQTPPERLGYILTVVGGELPAGAYTAVPSGMPVLQPQGSFNYGFDYDDHDFAFDLEVRTVDLNGNVSDPVVLHIDEHESGGCSSSAPRSEWLLLPVLGFVLRRRRRC